MSFGGFVKSLQDWYDSIWGIRGQAENFTRTMLVFDKVEALDVYWSNQTPEVKAYPGVKAAYDARRAQIQGQTIDLRDPLAKFIEGALDQWIESIQGLENLNPDQAKEKLSEISAKVIEIFGVSAALDVGLGMLPNGAGEASSTNTKELLKWLGFGAVLAAVAHDPVKIGLLRPYQDNLEATFRNRRPEYVGILNAFRQRSLSTTVVENTDDITDELMDQIENENNLNMDSYGAQWGYPQKWITIEKDAATKAMTFGNLMAMARLGYYDRGLSIFSLWTFGLDRRLMKNALKAIETSRDVGMWKGFRSMVEPSYVQGLIEAEDLRSYWDKILVPPDVQDWAMKRLVKSREKFAAKELKAQTGLTKDLTKSDWQQAYQAGIISVDQFESKLTALGYDETEIQLLIKLADVKKVGPTNEKCKRLPLSDFELAHRNGLITADQVLDRMRGEYCSGDIALEGQLIAIDDLTSEAPAQERDLTVSQLTGAYLDDIIDLEKFKTSLTALGFDDAEVTVLVSLANVKKDITAARTKKTSNSSSVSGERDLTLAQLTAAYVQNVIDEAAYTADLGSLGYDAAETAVLLKLAQIKKKLPSVEGLKRLPLGDYEKAWKYGQLTADQVLDRMRGEYREEDIQLERLLLTIGKP